MIILDLDYEQARFMADCIYMASKEGYYGTNIIDAWDIGVELCKKLGMSDEFIEDVELGI